MRRLRTLRFRSWVMPLLLAALVFRVLVPPGFMMGGAGSTSLSVSMCSTTSGKNESIELPGGNQPHCEFCVAPPLGTPLAHVFFESPGRATAISIAALVAQRDGSSLLRAQSARAPPRV